MLKTHKKHIFIGLDLFITIHTRVAEKRVFWSPGNTTLSHVNTKLTLFFNVTCPAVALSSSLLALPSESFDSANWNFLAGG